MWIFMAMLSAFFGGVTSILAKCGIKKTDSDIAMGIRIIVIFFSSFIIVSVTGSINSIFDIGFESYVFLILSGLTTGFSWIFYFKALSVGDINKIIAIDKTSVVLSIAFAIIFLGEVNNILIKIFGTSCILIGTILMIEFKTQNYGKLSGIFYAVLSAVFASLTSIFAKFGVNTIDSNLATFIRTIIILVMAFIIIFVRKKGKKVFKVHKKELLFICLSGVATAFSWICYYYAIKNGFVSIVISIDKLSILVCVLFSYLVFKERLNKNSFIGLISIISGTLLMTLFS